MKKSILLPLILLSGCSSTQPWVKSDGNAYDDNELHAALQTCDYKNRVSTSNQMMLTANTRSPEVHWAVRNADDTDEIKMAKASVKSTERTQSVNKQRSLSLAQEAYGCMQAQGFSKTQS